MEVKKNSVRNSERIDIPNDILRHYEELRNYALGYRTALVMPLGIDLFMKRGTYAWITAWSEYNTYKVTGSAPLQSADEESEPSIPQAIQPEITMLMTNMILSCGGIS